MRRVNLVPPLPLAARIRMTGIPLAVLLLGMAAIYVGLSYMRMERELALLAARRAELQQALARREATLAKLAAVKKKVEGLRQEKKEWESTVNELVKSKRMVPPLSNFLVLLSQTLPSSAKVEAIEIKGESGAVSGQVLRIGEMSTFVEALNHAPIVDGARLVFLEAVDKEHRLYRFKVVFVLKRG